MAGVHLKFQNECCEGLSKAGNTGWCVIVNFWTANCPTFLNSLGRSWKEFEMWPPTKSAVIWRSVILVFVFSMLSMHYLCSVKWKSGLLDELWLCQPIEEESQSWVTPAAGSLPRLATSFSFCVLMYLSSTLQKWLSSVFRTGSKEAECWVAVLVQAVMGMGQGCRKANPPAVLALQFLDNCERALILNTSGQINI